MNLLNRLYSWYGKRVVITTALIIIFLIAAGFLINFLFNTKEAVEAEPVTLPLVTLSSVKDMGSETAFRVTGTVKAVSEARLQTEASGRITNVSVSLGQAVRAGTVIASLENSAQSAALLQAQGAYEASEAASATSESGLQSAQTAYNAAQTSAITTYRSAYIATDSAVRSTVDDVFTDPESQTPGFRLDSFGAAVSLGSERSALEPILDAWAANQDSVTTSNIDERLTSALVTVQRVRTFTETISSVVERQDTTSSFTEEQKAALQAEFLAARSTLNQTLASLEAAQTNIKSTQEALDRATIAGSGPTVSLADAQLKSALGSLRAAQSNYEKTLVRTPISGVVNALYLKQGEYASMGMPAAVIANNNALEISTSLGSSDADRVAVGQEVIIDEGTKGIVTAIAPAIDPISGKKEIKIGVVDDVTLTNGSIVSIEFMGNIQNENPQETVNQVPLSALKITATGPVVFSVSEDSKLVAHPVVLGEIVGDTVVIESGVRADDRIVVDARGLKEGEEVEVAQ